MKSLTMVFTFQGNGIIIRVQDDVELQDLETIKMVSAFLLFVGDATTGDLVEAGYNAYMDGQVTIEERLI